jgi:peptide chain release factor 1
MFGQLDGVEKRFNEIRAEMARPGVAANPERFRKLTKVYHGLEEIVNTYREYQQIAKGLKEAGEIIGDSNDAELVDIAREEQAELQQEESRLAGKLQFLLIPRDPNDSKNTIVEIRAGAGGEEAALFAADLYRMYTRYSESRGWRAELLSANPTGIGGFKEVIFSVGGSDVYGNLKYESGVHRVQRIPETESSGRIHTSTSTVAVLPEAEEVDIEINPEEIRVDVYRSSGPGGQSVNTTDSAVRITHLPTGLIVQCQDEKSQHKNKAKAMKVLRARLLDRAIQDQRETTSRHRRAQVGTGDRSAKIRTYNFPQGRVTDHRIKLTLHRLAETLEGDLDDLINALRLADHAEKIKDSEQNTAISA